MKPDLSDARYAIPSFVLLSVRGFNLADNLVYYGGLGVRQFNGFFSVYHIINSVCCSHALVSVPTSKRPASDGGLCSGQLLIM